MNRLLWLLQIVLGGYFVAVGILHFVVPAGLPGPLSWMYDLSDGLHTVSGVAEILGGLGLILPGLTRIRPGLTVWAAAGLTIVMLGAAVWHLGREEIANVGNNLLLAVLLIFLAHRRHTSHPLPARGA